MQTHAAIFLTHIEDERIFRSFQRIQQQAGSLIDTHLCMNDSAAPYRSKLSARTDHDAVSESRLPGMGALAVAEKPFGSARRATPSMLYPHYWIFAPLFAGLCRNHQSMVMTWASGSALPDDRETFGFYDRRHRRIGAIYAARTTNSALSRQPRQRRRAAYGDVSFPAGATMFILPRGFE